MAYKVRASIPNPLRSSHALPYKRISCPGWCCDVRGFLLKFADQSAIVRGRRENHMTDEIEVRCPECGNLACRLTHLPVSGDHMNAEMFVDIWHGKPAKVGERLFCQCGFDILGGLATNHRDLRRNGERVTI